MGLQDGPYSPISHVPTGAAEIAAVSSVLVLLSELYFIHAGRDEIVNKKLLSINYVFFR